VRQHRPVLRPSRIKYEKVKLRKRKKNEEGKRPKLKLRRKRLDLPLSVRRLKQHRLESESYRGNSRPLMAMMIQVMRSRVKLLPKLLHLLKGAKTLKERRPAPLLHFRLLFLLLPAHL
jgi:hypothetical protein